MATDDTGDAGGDGLSDLDSKIPIAVSDAEGVPVDKLDETLYNTVDPTALKRLVDSDGLRRVVFDFCGYTVTVDGDGTVELEEHP